MAPGCTETAEPGDESRKPIAERLAISREDICLARKTHGSRWNPFCWIAKILVGIKRHAVYHFTFCFLSHPVWIWAIRRLAWVIRPFRPIPILGSAVVPTRPAHVREVLGRIDCFNVGEELTRRMPLGQVVLCIDWPRRHTEERELIEKALDCCPDTDEARIRDIVRECTSTALQKLEERPGVNFATEVCETIAIDVAARHFGIAANGPSQEWLRILRLLASQVFVGPPEKSRIYTETQICSDKLAELVSKRFEEAEAHLSNHKLDKQHMTVLERMIACRDQGLFRTDNSTQKRRRPSDPCAERAARDDWIKRTIGSLTVFGVATTTRAMVHAVSQILKRGGRRCAEKAAGDYHAAEAAFAKDSSETNAAALMQAKIELRRVAFEGLRFQPMLPLLGKRTALRETSIATTETCRTKVPSGSAILPSPLIAMFDPATFESPHCLCPRSRDLENYLHFGAGPHECVGRRVAEIQFEEILAQLFQHKNIRFGDRWSIWKVGYDGPATVRLMLTNA